MKELEYPFDPDRIMRKAKSYRRELLADGSLRVRKKIAILGGSTTDDIQKAMELFLLNDGIEPEFYSCEYAQYEQEALFPSEEFLSFSPDLIFIHTSTKNIRTLPSIEDDLDVIASKLETESMRLHKIWDALSERFGCPLIQNNFEMPNMRLLGNRDCWDRRGVSNYIRELNDRIYEYARVKENFYVHDLAYVAADYGLREWASAYDWNMYKYAMCYRAIPAFAYSVTSMIRSLFGQNKKALVLDLDNTLWGGVIGDDGVDGIDVGQETGAGQAYYDFQSYVKKLRSIGVMLGVSSKNDRENALEGLRHPNGVLRPEDFVSIRANWEPKDRNIAGIAEDMNILPDAVVFVDDNPAEREIAEKQLPGLVAPNIGSVEDYITTLDRTSYFEVTTLSEDDMKRNEMARVNLARQEAKAAYADYGEYLADLNMRAVIRDFLPVHIGRITQLTNKSNQFNLTTRRYTQTEMEDVSKDPSRIRLYGRLEDKFGDNGIVSVVIGKREEDVLHVELWLMSCRVLKRDMEFAMLDTLVEKCREVGVNAIRGYYFPTKKNGMVRDLYDTFGFRKTEESEDGNTVWELAVAGYKSKNQYIEVVNKESEEL